MDQMEVRWEYESEGYDLGSTNYLPDFWLPDLNCFVEIKGPEPTDDELSKARLLSHQSGKDVFVFHGGSFRASENLLPPQAYAIRGLDFQTGQWFWTQCTDCGQYAICPCGDEQWMPCKGKGCEVLPVEQRSFLYVGCNTLGVKAALHAAAKEKFGT
jgi:hypothetical protein